MTALLVVSSVAMLLAEVNAIPATHHADARELGMSLERLRERLVDGRRLLVQRYQRALDTGLLELGEQVGVLTGRTPSGTSRNLGFLEKRHRGTP